MAYQFTNAGNEYLQGPGTGETFAGSGGTVSFRFYPRAQDNFPHFVQQWTGGWLIRYEFRFAVSRVGLVHQFSNQARFYSNVGTSIEVADNAWHTCLVTYNNTNTSNRPNFYIDGVLQGTTTNASPSGTAASTDVDLRVSLGFSGDICEVAIWDGMLGGKEAVMLARGVSPLFIRPQSLIKYLPLTRDLQDVVKGGTLQAYNSPVVVPSNRVIKPSGQILQFPPASGTGSYTIYDNYYRQLLAGSTHV